MEYTYIILCVILFSSCSSNSTEVQKEQDETVTLDTLWTFNVGSFAKPMPLVSGDTVFAAGWTNVFAINTRTGNQHWRSSIADNNEIRGSYFMIDKEKLMVNHVKETHALNRKTGQPLWKFTYNDTLDIRMSGLHAATPLGLSLSSDKNMAINLDHNGKLNSLFFMTDDFSTNQLEYADDKLFVCQTNVINGAYTRGRLSAFDLYSGETLWNYTTEHNGFTFAPPVYEDGIVYAATIGNSDLSVAVALNATTGEVIWENIHDYLWTRGLGIGPKHVYINTGGSLAALDKQTGEIQWRDEWLGTASNIPVYLGGYVYFTDYSQIKIIDDNTGEVVHKEPVPPGGSYFWNVVVSEDKVFAQTSRQLIAYKPWHLREEE